MGMQVAAEDWIAHHARFSPHRDAIHDLASGRRSTYRTLDERISRAACFFHNVLGVRAGERIAVLCHNDSDVFEIQFACQRIGAIFLPVNWRLALPELEFIGNDATPRVLAYGKEFAQVAADVARRCGIEHLVSLNNGAASDYETGLARAEGAFETAALDITDTWMILYTSGTTGRPKGARITYGMALFNAVHATSAVALGVDSTNLVFLPTFHAAGLHLYANPIFQLGATNVVLRTFDPGRFLALLASKGMRITHLLGVPTNFLMMAQQPGFAEADLSHIVSIGVGGAAAPLALLETYAAKGVALQQLWGMRQSFLDGSLTRLMDPDKILRQKIVEFVETGSFGLASGLGADGGYVRLWHAEPITMDEVAFDDGVFLLTKAKAEALRTPTPDDPPPGPKPVPKPDPRPGPGPGPAPTPGSDTATATIQVKGTVPREIWNRLGTKVLPKLTTGSDLSIGVEFSVNIGAGLAASLEADLKQVLDDLGLQDQVKVERS